MLGKNMHDGPPHLHDGGTAIIAVAPLAPCRAIAVG
jgi:hypothetical protein